MLQFHGWPSRRRRRCLQVKFSPKGSNIWFTECVCPCFDISAEDIALFPMEYGAAKPGYSLFEPTWRGSCMLRAVTLHIELQRLWPLGYQRRKLQPLNHCMCQNHWSSINGKTYCVKLLGFGPTITGLVYLFHVKVEHSCHIQGEVTRHNTTIARMQKDDNQICPHGFTPENVHPWNRFSLKNINGGKRSNSRLKINMKACFIIKTKYMY